MHDHQNAWAALCVLVFLLGLKHGLDPDHLAAIDGLTRHNLRAGRSFSRYCGLLFSVGHGLIVMAIALAVGTTRTDWVAPHWLEAVGAWIAIVFLVSLGVANLRALLLTPSHQIVFPAGIKGRLLGPLMQARKPLSVAFVGACFAVSFDTVSQTALFSMAATHFGGVERALALGLLFALGMIATDGASGLWVARLISRTDLLAAAASRVMSGAIAGLSLAVAGLGVARQTLPNVGFSEGGQLEYGALVILATAVSYLMARWFAVRGQPKSATAHPSTSRTAFPTYR